MTLDKSISFLMGQLLEGIMENDTVNMYLFLDPSLVSRLKHSIKSNQLVHGFVSLYMKSPTARDIASKEIKELYEQEETHFIITYRRISASRLQALVETTTDLAFVWESSSIDPSMHTFTLIHVMFKESDDDVFYWIPWSISPEDAESDYMDRKMMGRCIKLRQCLIDTSPSLKTIDDLSNWVEQCEHVEQNDLLSDEEGSDDAYWSRYSQVDVY